MCHDPLLARHVPTPRGSAYHLSLTDPHRSPTGPSRGFPPWVRKGHVLSPSRKLHTWGAVVRTPPLWGTASKRTRGPRSHTGPRRLRMSQGRDFIRPRMLRFAHDGSTPGHLCVPVSTPGRGAMGEFLAEIKVRINET